MRGELGLFRLSFWGEHSGGAGDGIKHTGVKGQEHRAGRDECIKLHYPEVFLAEMFCALRKYN